VCSNFYQARVNPAIAYGIIGHVGGLDHLAACLKLPHIEEIVAQIPGRDPPGYDDEEAGRDMDMGDAEEAEQDEKPREKGAKR
jgi:hypothetical protein